MTGTRLRSRTVLLPPWRWRTRNIFNLLITDVTLPDGSGWTLLKRLRELMPALPGIAVTGHAHPRDIDRSERAGFCIHLSKPIKPEQLCDAIRRCAVTPESN